MRTKTILTTRRLRLRTWRHSDAQAYHRHCNTADVMEHLGGVMTPRQLKLEVRWFMRHQERHGITFWVVERKRDRAFLGFCGLIRVSETSSTVLGKLEIGWRIRSDMWRCGYAYEAAQAALKYGQDHYTERIISRVVPSNAASRGLMLKLGMKRLPELDYVDPRDRTPLIVYGV
jgi:RimJ/RimL family protein N-acetyltransferase